MGLGHYLSKKESGEVLLHYAEFFCILSRGVLSHHFQEKSLPKVATTWLQSCVVLLPGYDLKLQTLRSMIMLIVILIF